MDQKMPYLPPDVLAAFERCHSVHFNDPTLSHPFIYEADVEGLPGYYPEKPMHIVRERLYDFPKHSRRRRRLIYDSAPNHPGHGDARLLSGRLRHESLLTYSLDRFPGGQLCSAMMGMYKPPGKRAGLLLASLTSGSDKRHDRYAQRMGSNLRSSKL